MYTAEELYRTSDTDFSQTESPPAWLDGLFVIVISCVHIIYIFRFCTFSLRYLKAKCNEKLSNSKWSASKLYLAAILSHRRTGHINVDEFDQTIYTKLWSQLSLIRNLVRIFLFVCCGIILILYLSLVLNICFEYFVICTINAQNGSFLALAIFPFLWFINCSILRFMIYGMLTAWSMNVDNIANNIAAQQRRESSKRYARRNEADHSDDIEQQRLIGTTEEEESKQTLKYSLKGFTSEYFMAFHWRLSVITLSVIATIFAMPTFHDKNALEQNQELGDTFWMQIFLRYIILAMICWLILYFFLIIFMAMYGQIANNKNKSLKQCFCRFFCLMHAFDIRDTNRCWKCFKIFILSLSLLVGIVCIIIGSLMEDGLIRFVGIICFLFYVFEIFLVCKVRGIHYLWQSDMNALELSDFEYAHDDDEDAELEVFVSSFEQICNEQRNFYERQRQRACYQQCCGYILILCNYIVSMFKLYKIYWRFVLPFYYEIRPLSVCSKSKSIAERIIKYDYSNSTVLETMKKLFFFIWHGLRGLFCCGLCVLALMALMYLSITLNDNLYDNADNNKQTFVLSANVSDNYPICDTQWKANLSVFDMASLAHMAYEIGDSLSDQIMSMQQLMCLYFDGMSPAEAKNNSLNCRWQILHIDRSRPAFVHMRHYEEEIDLIAIRGTYVLNEMLQDVSLYNEVALLQAASWILPITTILPQSLIIRIAYFASHFEGSIDKKVRTRFDKPLFEYCANYLLKTPHSIKSLYFVGHSLGGGIAQIVAAQLHHIHKRTKYGRQNAKYRDLEIKSFSVAAPGSIWNSRKFSFDIIDLYETAQYLRPQHDLVSSVDVYGGLTQNVECNEQEIIGCHLTKNIICELTQNCNVHHSHNPKIIESFCLLHDTVGELFMNYANYSS